MQPNTSPKYAQTYLSNPYDEKAVSHATWEILSGKTIASIKIVDLATILEAKHIRAFRRLNQQITSLTIPLKQTLLAAEMCYILNGGLHYTQPGRYDQVKADLQHALIRNYELLFKFEKILESWAKAECGPTANASHAFELIDENVFVPIIESFYKQMDIFQQVTLVEELTEYKNTTIVLVRDIMVLVS